MTATHTTAVQAGGTKSRVWVIAPRRSALARAAIWTAMLAMAAFIIAVGAILLAVGIF